MTLYGRIAHDLRESIQGGGVLPGDTIPSIRELMQRYNVARDTVRDAVAVLTHEGLVIPRQGIGTIVRDVQPLELHSEPDVAPRTWAEQTGEAGVDLVVVSEWEDADPDTAGRLGIASGASVLHRVRHQTYAGIIAQVMEQWIPYEIVTGIQEHLGLDFTDLDAVNAYQGPNLFELMAAVGHAPVRTTEAQSARMPRPDEREIMEIPAGVAVLVTDRRTLEKDKVPVEVSCMVGTGDRISVSYDVTLRY
jgi:GntR family transcriptional regulator